MIEVRLVDEFALLRPETRIFGFGLEMDEAAANKLGETISEITGVHRCDIEIVSGMCNFKAYAWKPSLDDEVRIYSAIHAEIAKVMP